MKKKFLMPDGEIREADMPQWKTPWNHDTNFESDRTALYCDDESLTKQEFKEDADINTIIARFTRTGEPPPMALPEHFMDITGKQTYEQISERLAEANAAFYTLPAATRSQFLNDPTRWADEVMKRLNKADGDGLKEIGVDITIKQPEKPAPAPAGTANEGGAGSTPATPPSKGAKAPGE